VLSTLSFATMCKIKSKKITPVKTMILLLFGDIKKDVQTNKGWWHQAGKDGKD